MTELKIMLSQIESNDLIDIKNRLDAGFSKLLDDSIPSTIGKLEQWFDKEEKIGSHWFAIKAAKSDDYKHFIVGFCGLSQIDTAARHARLTFAMVDGDGHRLTMQSYPPTRSAVDKILGFAFNDINLNKVWIEVLEHNDIKENLEYFGFAADGIRKASLFKNGKFLNSFICSLTAKEYRGRK